MVKLIKKLKHSIYLQAFIEKEYLHLEPIGIILVFFFFAIILIQVII